MAHLSPALRPIKWKIVLGVIAFFVVLAVIGSRSEAERITNGNAADHGAPRAFESSRPRHLVPRIDLTAMQEQNDEFRVQTNFAEDGVVLRVEGHEYPLVERAGMTYIFAGVYVPKIGVNNAKLQLSSGEAVPFEVVRTMHTLDEWRKYAEPFDFKKVDKNPDRYAGQLVKGRAKIYQIQENGSATVGGLYVTSQGYGYWSDNVRFTLPKVTDLVEDDVVNFYGEVVGSYSYESQAGWNITVPMLELTYLEK